MVMFIKQEAEEKANEIRMSAEEVRDLFACVFACVGFTMFSSRAYFLRGRGKYVGVQFRKA